MLSFLRTVAWLSLLCCTVCSADSQYLQKCKDTYPNSQSMQVFFEQDIFCVYTCWGTDANGNFVGETFNKDNGTPCKQMYVNDYPSVCYNQTCVPEDTVNMCKRSQPGKIQYIQDNECKVTCIGENNSVMTVERDPGASCLKGRFIKGKCSTNRRCLEVDSHYVPDPNDGATANADVAQSICKKRHEDKVTQAYQVLNDICEFGCFYENSSEEYGYSLEFLKFMNGYSCNTNNNEWCFNGRCTSQMQATACEYTLGQKPTAVDKDGCTLVCMKGDKEQRTVDMPPGSNCTGTGIYYGMSGTCTADRQCAVN